MGFKNNPAYVQKQIDNLLRPFKTFAKTYVDNVVIFNQSMNKHTSHLEHVFNLFDKMNIVLKFSKSYIGYPKVVLLNKKIDNFGLSISADKFETIRTIKFPRNSKTLKRTLFKKQHVYFSKTTKFYKNTFGGAWGF